MAKSVEGESANFEIPSPALSEIDALVEQLDEDFVLGNLKDLLKARAATRAILKKLSAEEVLDNATELMSYGVTQEGIKSVLGRLEILRYKEKVVAAGIVIDPDELLKEIQEWQEESGIAPHDAVTVDLDFILALGVDANEMLAVIRKDPRGSEYFLVQSARKLKEAGADLPIEEVDGAIEDIWASSRSDRIIFENLTDLLAIGSRMNVAYFVEETLKEQDGAGKILSNYEAIVAAGIELNLAELVEKAPWYSVNHVFDFLLSREDVPLKTTLEKLTRERVNENIPRLLSAFIKRKEDINLLVDRLQGSQLIDRIEVFLEAGADREFVLRRIHGFWILRELRTLIEAGFTIDELIKQVDHRDRIENYKALKSYGAELDLSASVDGMLDRVDEFYLRDFPDAYEDIAKFLLDHLESLQASGVDILKIKDDERIRDIVEQQLGQKHRSLFTIAQIKAVAKQQ